MVVDDRKCSVCGAESVRLYRPYAMFRRDGDDLCNACVPDDRRGWYVPSIMDLRDGSIWGYTSVPEVDVKRFMRLPERSKSFPAWNWNR